MDSLADDYLNPHIRVVVSLVVTSPPRKSCRKMSLPCFFRGVSSAALVQFVPVVIYGCRFVLDEALPVLCTAPRVCRAEDSHIEYTGYKQEERRIIAVQ